MNLELIHMLINWIHGKSLMKYKKKKGYVVGQLSMHLRVNAELRLASEFF